MITLYFNQSAFNIKNKQMAASNKDGNMTEVVVKQNNVRVCKLYYTSFDTNFLQFYRQEDDPIQFFHLIKYLKLKLPFPTTQKYIKTYLTTMHDPLLKDESRLEEDTMTKLAYLVFINTNKLSVNTMENIITKACGMISVIKNPVDFVVCKHLKAIVILYCPTVTFAQKTRLANQIRKLEYNMFSEESYSDFCGYDEYEELRFYFDNDSVDNEM